MSAKKRKKKKKKSSEVLKQFIEPYLAGDRILDEHRGLLGAAVIAWNLALVPEDDQKNMLDELLSQTPVHQPDTFKKFINELKERKQKYFPDIKRFILSYDLCRSKKALALA